MPPSIPDPGQLVTVRQRRYVVSDVARSALPPDVLLTVRDSAPQHLVRLQSVEDDGLGEELQVVWEIEPGARVYEKATLPSPTEGFDEPERLDAFLNAVRWGAVASADVRALNAPFRSGITIEEYQLDPVVRALEMPRVNLLIADDVGLGKTIEAGLVVQELMLRHRARTVLVVCPAGLQLQWRDQMRDKFGLEFRVVDSEAMRGLRRQRGLHVNPWTHFPRLITSIDFLKRDRPLRLFREVLPAEGQPAFPRKFDLLIVDEAHNVAPSGAGNYPIDSQRTEAVRTIGRHFEHKLFLSATPHNGYTASFAALLELLDDQRFHRGFEPDEAQVRAVMVRRLKSELAKDDLGRARFPKRVLVPIELDYPEAEKRAHVLLSTYARLRGSHADSAAEKFATEFVLKLLKKRLFSSPEAFKLTLERHRATMRGQGKAKRVTAPSLRLLQREVEGADEETLDEEEATERLDSAVETTAAAMRKLTAEEDSALSRLAAWADQAAAKPDVKARELLNLIKRIVKPDGKWSDARIVVFTEYRATQNWLLGLLADAGLTAKDRVKMLYGGMVTDEREAVKAAFQAAPAQSSVRILLATDAASEGIDLQNHCCEMVHFEIPWNPNRLEQRNGRIDRHGQRKPEVHIYHFVGKGYDAKSDITRPGDLEGDLEFLARAAWKVDQIREDLGSVGDVIARQVEEAMLGKRRQFNPEGASPRAARVKKALRFEQKLRERLRELHDKLFESRAELQLSPENLRRVVEVGLALAGHAPLTLTKAQLDGPPVDAWHVPELGGSWAVCREGLAHPHTGEMRPLVFDDKAAIDRDDVVLAHLNHRLAQMCLRLLRSEVWAPEGQRKLRRVSVRVVPNTALEHPAVLVYGRLVVLGGDHERLHEEVITAGGLIREGKFTRFQKVGDVEKLLAALAGTPSAAAAADVTRRLVSLWAEHEGPLLAALETRRKDRDAALIKKLGDRADREARDIRAVLTELAETIRRQLEAAPEEEQLELWKEEEKEQLTRNRDAMGERLKAIPAEAELEVAAIRRRYEKPESRLFPVAITYAIPEKLARGPR